MKNEHGYVLTFTLLLFVILMLLITKGFQLSETHIHIQQNQWSIFQAKAAALSLLQSLSQEDPHRLTCFSDSGKPSTLCRGSWHHVSVDYFVEFLSEDPCSLIEEKAADFYRITLSMTSKSADPPITFEEVFALPGKIRKDCRTKTRTLTPFHQSFRMR